MSRLFIWIIRGYQRFLSPHLGNNCRFTPTCSQYAIEALQVHGFFKGSLLAIWRILRCNPIGRCGSDPVPPKGRWKNDTPARTARDAEEALQELLAQDDDTP